MNMPVVFISATKEDLEPYRQAARDAVIKAGCHPEMMEYFAAGGNPPLPTCLEKVAPCDLLVVIVAHRYGWIPENQAGGAQKSITWLETELAHQNGKEVLAFFLADSQPWPEEQKESYRITRAMSAGKATQELFQEVNSAVQQLKNFKSWLQSNVTVAFFTDANSLAAAVLHALQDWQQRHPSASSRPKAPVVGRQKPEIPPAYRLWLSGRCATVELMVNLMRQGCSPPRLSAIYVPAPTLAWGKEKAKEGEILGREEKLFFLLDRLGQESLYAPGLAGSGKSTFCRWLAYLLCQGAMPEQRQIPGQKPIVERFPDKLKDKLPLLVPLREFWPFLPSAPGQRESSRQELEQALAGWMDTKTEALDWPLVNRFLAEGQAVLLLDGVDEVPVSVGAAKNGYYPREMLISGLQSALPSWLDAGNRALLTSRPYGISDSAVRSMGLAPAELSDLPEPLQRLFIQRWFAALAYEPEMAQWMIDHLDEREELKQLTGNPVLLMAMCVLFPEGRRLPQDKAELYQKTIDRMLFNRYGDTIEVDKVHHRLSVVAYGMHTGTGLEHQRQTPQAEVKYDEIDRMLTHYLEQKSYTEKGLTTVAEAREELLSRSGLLVQRGQQAAAFYHLSFQEYLAGHRLLQLAGDRLEQDIQAHADVPEWRQTLNFTFGAALQDARSPEKGIAIIKTLLTSASLKRLARLVLTADLIEIIYRKGYGLERELEGQFQQLCLEAIEKEVSLRERYDLGRVLGLVGDPRIVVDLRHPPAGYVRIRAGIYLVGEEKRSFKINQDLWLSQYPVTNSQFRLFIDAGGYQEERWWSSKGRAWREENQVSEPGLWRHGKWNGPNQPVVGVSWYEAEAFCRWAGGRLPGEWEWQAAAAGPGGFTYPWGNDWRDGICNSGESGLGKTSPVGLFPRSRSRDFGLEDMAGNVWEWCDDWYDKDKDFRVVRGGAFFYNPYYLRCEFRNNDQPHDRFNNVGFRVVWRAQS